MTTLQHAAGAASSQARPTVLTSFRLGATFGAQTAEIAGDFSAWAPIAMIRAGDGVFTLQLELERGRRWRYRFLLDDTRWINDPDASCYVTGPNGSPASAIVT